MDLVVRNPFLPDYLEAATAVVVPGGVGKILPVHRYSVDIFSYSGHS